MSDYRQAARASLKRARAELESKDDQRLKYAALELRMAMESVTYDRAIAFKDDFPEAEYDTWQPRKVLEALLEIDPEADQGSTLSIAPESSLGVTAGPFKVLGTEVVLDMATLKKNYDALGSYLHVQNIRQIKSDKKISFTSLRSRCENLASYLDGVLSSQVHNIIIGIHTSFECVACGKQLRRRVPKAKSIKPVECDGCGCLYDLTEQGENVIIEPKTVSVRCPQPSCGEFSSMGLHVMREVSYENAVSWKCTSCNGLNVIKLGITCAKPVEETANQPERNT